MSAVDGKKNQADTLENQQNFDCFGTRTSSIDVFDEKTGPTTIRTIKIADNDFFDTLVRSFRTITYKYLAILPQIFIKTQGYCDSS